MNYQLVKANVNDINKLFEYQLHNILKYATNLSSKEINEIKEYVKTNISKQLNHYKMIYIDGKKIGYVNNIFIR